MPELPDVEIYKRHLDARGIGKRIDTLRIRDQRLLKGAAPSTLRRHLKSHKLASSRRHGKLLFAAIEGDDASVLMHFGMTGWLEGYGRGDAEPGQSAVILEFSDGSHLAYCDPRTFGRFDLIHDVDAYLKDHELGPDALDGGFDLAHFREALRGRSGNIKAALMNQSVLAGVGNVYSDEILMRAGVHPESDIRALDEGASRAIHRAMRYVLKKAIEARANPEDMPKSFILPDRKQGAACPACGGKLTKRRVAGRSAYFCGNCQRRY